MDQYINPNIKIIGRIDLDAYYTPRPHQHQQQFRLLSVEVTERDRCYQCTLFDQNKVMSGCGFTLLVGRNGVGKSYLLRAIIELFVDFELFRHRDKLRKYTQRYKAVSIKYLYDDHVYCIKRVKGGFCGTYDDNEIPLNDIIVPNIVAAHFGLYDRFPTKDKSYDVPFYNYVGAKAGGNFISTNNIMTQMLFTLCEDREDTVVERIKDVFYKIGYVPRITVRVKLNESDKASSFEDFKSHIDYLANNSTSFNSSLYQRLKRQKVSEKRALYNVYRSLRNASEIVLDLEYLNGFKENREKFSSIYLLKQLQLTSKINYILYKDGYEIDCNSLSSGEANMLAMTVGVASSISGKNTLILIDEPELNQHPNWQMSIIDQLNSVFEDYPCHLLIATHSHFLVSDLPMDKSVVLQMDYNDNLGLITELLQSNTYGWSAEEVLLKVFNTSTDRNIYLGNILGQLLDRIKDGNISREEVTKELAFLVKVSENLKDFDPLKRIIDSLVKAFSFKATSN